MWKKWKGSVDQDTEFGARLADLSKAFGSFGHELLIGKRNVYGFNLRVIHNYLNSEYGATKKMIQKFFYSKLNFFYG